MTNAPHGSQPVPSAARGRVAEPLDAAASVLLALAVAALLGALVLGVRGFLLLSDTDATTRLCTTDDVSMGECELAVSVRRTVAGSLLTGAGAGAVGGAVLLVAGTRRGNAVVRYRTSRS